MQIKTELLQKMVSKAIQGASNNKMIPITSLIGIEAKGDTLTLMTTDGSNQLRVTQKIEVDGQVAVSNEFYTIVNADVFSKLVGKTSKEFITLTNNQNYLTVKGNGEYKLDIAINEEGQMVRFSEIPYNNEATEAVVMSVADLKNSIEVSKPSVSKTMEIPCLTGYYVGDKIITTDRQLVCVVNNKLIETPLLISSDMAELVCLLDGDKVSLAMNNEELLFKTDNIIIYGKQLEGRDIYPVTSIENLVGLTYDNNVVVKKQELLDVLDRMSLFIKQGDNNAVYLDFTPDGLQLRSKSSSAVELIQIENNNSEIQLKEFSCLADIDMLKSQINTISTDSINIYYGQGKSIKLVDGNCTHIISLVEKAEAVEPTKESVNDISNIDNCI